MRVALEFDTETRQYTYRGYTVDDVCVGVGYEAYGEYTYTEYEVSHDGRVVHTVSSMADAVAYVDSQVDAANATTTST